MMLRLRSTPSFAAPAAFLARFPGTKVRLATSADHARFADDEFDADIVYGMPRQDGLVVVPLGEETAAPLCTPDLARRIATPIDLFRCVLIENDTS